MIYSYYRTPKPSKTVLFAHFSYKPSYHRLQPYIHMSGEYAARCDCFSGNELIF